MQYGQISLITQLTGRLILKLRDPKSGKKLVRCNTFNVYVYLCHFLERLCCLSEDKKTYQHLLYFYSKSTLTETKQYVHFNQINAELL